MFTEQITGTSAAGPGAALGQAISAGLSFSNEAHSLHMLIQSIVKVGKEWKATVTVILEPHAQPDAKAPRSSPGTQVTEQRYDDDSDSTRAEKRRKRELNLRLQEQIQAEIHTSMQMQAENEEAMLTHIYMQIMHEDIFRSLQNLFNFDYVHVIAEGSLWNAAKEIHPDLELYEAAHNNRPERVNKFKPSPRLKRGYSPALNNNPMEE